MPYAPRPVPRVAVIVFPIVVTVVVGLLVPESAPLVATLMLGSLMQAEIFLQVQTLYILLLGLAAFALDTVAGIFFGKLLCLATRGKVNPLVGAAGISAFPMSGRLVQRVAQEEDFTNHVLMHAMGANTAGQLGSVIAGGVLLALVTGALG